MDVDMCLSFQMVVKHRSVTLTETRFWVVTRQRARQAVCHIRYRCRLAWLDATARALARLVHVARTGAFDCASQGLLGLEPVGHGGRLAAGVLHTVVAIGVNGLAILLMTQSKRISPLNLQRWTFPFGSSQWRNVNPCRVDLSIKVNRR